MTLSGYGELTSLTNVFLWLEAHCFNASGGEIGSGFSLTNFSSTSYQLQKVDFTTPTGVAKIRVKICFGVTQAVQYGLVDDISLLKH